MKTFTRKFTPAVAMMTYKTATTTGYGPAFKRWLDINSSDTPHYGYKLALNGTPNGSVNMRIWNTVYVSWAGRR